MAKMKLVTPDINELADAIARRIAWLLIKGLEHENDPDRGKCPNCGRAGFIDYCFGCNFVPYWEKGPARTCTCKGHPDGQGEGIKKYDPTEEPFA